MTTALYAGSFSPFHLGHLSVLSQAADIFEKVYVVIAINNSKCPVNYEERAIRALEQRADDIKICVQDLFDNVEVLVLPPKTLLFDLAMELGVEALVRGVRNGSDLDSELQIRDLMANSGLKTVFLTADASSRHISSSMVREVMSCRGWYDELSDLVPLDIKKAIIERDKEAFLIDVWHDCCKQLYGFDYNRNVAKVWIESILNSYRPRQYHNIDHLYDLINYFTKGSSFDLVICLAAFFHDYVCFPSADRNEEDSVDRFNEFNAAVGTPKFETRDVIQQILNTKISPSLNQPYRVNKGLPELEYHYELRNQDCAVLAADKAEYDNYRQKVRREYLTYSDSTYAKGRIAVLEKLLGMPIFYGRGASSLRERAYANMRREIEELKKMV